MTEQDRHSLRPLLERVVQRDRQAYEELFVKLRPYLHALVRRTLGPNQGGIDYSAIVQSSLRRIHENFDGLLDDDPTVPHLLAWIKMIVRNRAIDEARRRANAPAGGAEPFLALAPDRQPAESARERDGRSLDVLAALRRLPERQRLVVEWHYFDRLRDAEISARLGGSVAAIRVLRCRALKELRRLMEANHVRE
jgi:RNA polymerase sigma factor (sigma-70 family)